MTQFPRKESSQSQSNIGPRRRMQLRTYPFVSVILSPGSKIGHTPRKNPSAYWRTATSRINAYRGLRRTLVTFRPSLSQPRMIIAHVSRRCKCFLGDFLNFFEKILRFAERRFPMSPEGFFRFASVLRCSQAPVFGSGRSVFPALPAGAKKQSSHSRPGGGTSAPAGRF